MKKSQKSTIWKKTTQLKETDKRWKGGMREPYDGTALCIHPGRDHTSLHMLIKMHRTKYTHISACSVRSSHSVMLDSLRPHGLQYTRLPCPSATLGAYSNSCPLSRWCHPTISSSVIPFSSGFQSFPASGSFPMSELFAWGGQNIGVSASASVLPMNIQDWLVGSPCSSRDSQESSPAPQFKRINSSVLNFLYGPTLTSIHDYWKNHSFD